MKHDSCFTVNIAHLFKKNSDGVVFYTKVAPKSSQDKIGKLFKESSGHLILKIYVTAAPEDGKANKAVINLLSKCWHLKKSQITIKSGLTEPHKKIQILGDADLILNQILSIAQTIRE